MYRRRYTYKEEKSKNIFLGKQRCDLRTERHHTNAVKTQCDLSIDRQHRLSKCALRCTHAEGHNGTGDHFRVTCPGLGWGLGCVLRACVCVCVCV